MKFTEIIRLIRAAVFGGYSVSTDSQMIDRFKQRKMIFETIFRMTQEDKVESLWYFDLPKSRPPIADARILEYKALLNQAGIAGILRLNSALMIFFPRRPYYSKAEEKNYAYSVGSLEHVVESLDKVDAKFEPGAMCFRHLEGNWYLQYANNSMSHLTNG